MYDDSHDSVSTVEKTAALSNEALEEGLLLLTDEYINRFIKPEDEAQRARVLALTASIETIVGNELAADMIIALVANLQAGIVAIREYVDLQSANGTDNFVKA